MRLWCCGAEYDPESEYRHWCRNPPYTMPRVQKILTSETFRCRCHRLRKYQHASLMECEMAQMTEAEVAAFIVRTGCGPRNARYMLWLERNFGG